MLSETSAVVKAQPLSLRVETKTRVSLLSCLANNTTPGGESHKKKSSGGVPLLTLIGGQIICKIIADFGQRFYLTLGVQD